MGHNWWQTRDVCLWCQNKVSIIPMEVSEESRQKNMSSPVNYEVFLTFSFYSNTIVHHGFLPSGCTINKEYYLEGLHNLCQAMQRKTNQTLERQIVDFAPQKHTGTHSFIYPTVFGKTCHCCAAITSLFSRQDALWLSYFPILSHTKDIFQQYIR